MYEALIEKLMNSTVLPELDDCFQLIRNNFHEDETEVLDARGKRVSLLQNPENVKKSLDHLFGLRSNVLQLLKNPKTACKELEELFWKTMLLAAPYHFDSYCIYIEKSRPLEKKFYEPRRKQLKVVADAMQKLEDDEIDILTVSLAPGVGKTTLAIFYITWVAGKHPELQNLIGSHNNEFLRGVYDECLRVMDKNGEYLWTDVFPSVGITGTNAKDMRIDLGNKKRFQTIELTSLGAGNAGKVRATNLLYCDDLVEGIEQAMSRDQMDKLWNKYTVDLRQRKQGKKCKELHIATRWSVNDVIGRLESVYANDPRFMSINLPVRDENGESLFDYPYGLGYTTKMIEDLEVSMDDISFKALYLGEPIEREGQLYAPSELRRYFELPEREPDAIVAVCDTKEQGNDYCAMPIVYQYGDDFYIDKWICDNGKPDIIEQRIVNLLAERGVKMARFESNRGGSIFAENVKKGLKEKGSHCKVLTRWNETNKQTRILMASGWVKEHCLFKDESAYKLDKEYRLAMQELSSYTMSGKNLHDDVPDVLADLEDFASGWRMNKVEVLKRVF